MTGIETDGTVTTLTAIRNNVIDEFVEKAWKVLGSEDCDIYARESIIEIAEQLKNERVEFAGLAEKEEETNGE